MSKDFHAWWPGSDEPDFHSNLSIKERERRSRTGLGPGTAFFDFYPLEAVEGAYYHLIALRPDVHPFILTRSGFAGIRPASDAIWSTIGRQEGSFSGMAARRLVRISGIRPGTLLTLATFDPTIGYSGALATVRS